MVHRLTAALLTACMAAAATSGCATYSQDLERARLHYQANDFARTLAVLRVLGEDMDALSPTEQDQYAYLRGMTDLRLSASSPSTPEPARQALRACARDWLAVSLEGSPARAGLSPEQRARAHASLADLVDVEAPRGACLEP